MELDLKDDWYLETVRLKAEEYWLSYASSNQLIKEAAKLAFEKNHLELGGMNIGSIELKESTLECARNGQNSAIGALIKRGLNQLVSEQTKVMMPEIRKILINKAIKVELKATPRL